MDTHITVQYLYDNNSFLAKPSSQKTKFKTKKDCFYLFFFFCM